MPTNGKPVFPTEIWHGNSASRRSDCSQNVVGELQFLDCSHFTHSPLTPPGTLHILKPSNFKEYDACMWTIFFSFFNWSEVGIFHLLSWIIIFTFSTVWRCIGAKFPTFLCGDSSPFWGATSTLYFGLRIILPTDVKLSSPALFLVYRTMILRVILTKPHLN